MGAMVYASIDLVQCFELPRRTEDSFLLGHSGQTAATFLLTAVVGIVVSGWFPPQFPFDFFAGIGDTRPVWLRRKMKIGWW
jgi:hypothetical protein